MKNIYVDGQHGTTGLEIKKLIGKHPEFELVEIPYEERHDIGKRKTLINAADAVVLCLPEKASQEAIDLIESPKIVVVDTSTAFRTNPEWVYGLPELSVDQKTAICSAKRVANPGCHASAVLLGILPLQKIGALDASIPLSFTSHTGYSGGGKEMISMYKNSKKMPSAQFYALEQQHKHIPEIVLHGKLAMRPTFMPIVCNYPRGIIMSFPIHKSQLKSPMSLEGISELYKQYYRQSPFSVVHEPNDTGGKLHGETTGGNQFDIYFTGTEENLVISVKLDNLGKGASGSVIQNLNLIFDLPERMGL